MKKNSPPRPADIRPEYSIPLLQALHILTREGKLNQDSRRKLKQIEHLYQFIAPLLNALTDGGAKPILVDHGAGKSYLGFLLYDLFFKARQTGTIYSIETRAPLVAQSQALAETLGFERMHFLASSIEGIMHTPDLPQTVDIVTALHACDTATDDALRFALLRQAQFIVLVPCCQAEVATHLRAQKNLALSQSALAELWRHPIHTREFASIVTNALRCLYLESQGYHVSVTELIGWEHSLKNELIIARYTGERRGNAAARIQTILSELKLDALSHRFPESLI